MNYLDLLPTDVMKIINRKVEDLHIIDRRKERKVNRKMNREQKRMSDYKRDIYEKYIFLYKSLKEKRTEKKQLEYCEKMNEAIKQKLGDSYLKTTFYIGDDEPYIIVWCKIGQEIFRITVYDEKSNNSKIEYMYNINDSKKSNII